MNKWKIEKLNELMENGINVIQTNKNQIILNNGMVIEYDINANHETYLFWHEINGYVNHGFTFIEKLDFKTIKTYIDNLMFDLFHK